MNKIHVIRNEDVNQALIGTPEGHKHLRVCMKLKNGSVIIFQEATIANIFSMNAVEYDYGEKMNVKGD